MKQAKGVCTLIMSEKRCSVLDILGKIAEILGLAVAIAAFMVSYGANKIASTANEFAFQANGIALKSNDIALSANDSATEANHIAMENLRPQLVVSEFTLNKNLEMSVYTGSKVAITIENNGISIGETLAELLRPIEMNAGYVKEVHRIIKLEKDLENQSRERRKPDLLTTAFFDDYYLLYDFCASTDPLENRVLVLAPLTITLTNSGMPVNKMQIVESYTLKRDGSKDPRFVQGSSSQFFVADNEKIELSIAFMLPGEMALPNKQQRRSGLGLIETMMNDSLPLYSIPAGSQILRDSFDLGTLGLKFFCIAEDGNQYDYAFYLEFDRVNGLLERIYIEYGGNGNNNWQSFKARYETALSSDDMMNELLFNVNIDNPDFWKSTLYERNPNDYSLNNNYIHDFDKLTSKIFNTYIASEQWKIREFGATTESDFSLKRDYVLAVILDECEIIDMNAMGLSFTEGSLSRESYILYSLSSDQIISGMKSRIEDIDITNPKARLSFLNEFISSTGVDVSEAEKISLALLTEEKMRKMAEQLNLGYWQEYHYWREKSTELPLLDVFFAKIYHSFERK